MIIMKTVIKIIFCFSAKNDASSHDKTIAERVVEGFGWMEACF